MAKPFRFNLERVLDIRGQLEERAKMELGKANVACAAKQREIDRLINEKNAREASMSQKAVVMPDELWLWQAYRKRLVADIQTGQVKLAELEEVRERCRRTLLTRSKDKKLLEKLKSNKAERHAQQEKLAEQNENDDMASIRYQPPVY
ncbi:MAG: flagellar export protein FliJ [Solidesulfovibrio magneticus str. Maddingley MBC34]|uniref:Flagellar FliJ protein n=1 Tax=Solidesulfovibrio magneticus str. Maddingley MBC34 TaxID=1206767 RepID=K6GC94_9BACT|nr:MAG: flagellar export protein FliJ [Solidesulfovibrio magneticus str. Maddingley MBC34]